MDLEKKEKEIEWYNNSRIVIDILLGLILLTIIVSQSFAASSTLSASEVFSDILNHDSTYLLILVYFVFIKFPFGKKYFDYLSVLVILLYFFLALTSLLTIFQSFNLASILTFFVNLLILFYLFHTFLKVTNLWDEFKLYKSPFNEFTNNWCFYAIMVVAISLLAVNLIGADSFKSSVLAVFDAIYVILFARYIFLFRSYIDSKDKDTKDKSEIFNLIMAEKKALPKVKNVTAEVEKQELNFYQKVAVIVDIICFFLGIIFGNIYPACANASANYTTCSSTVFNFSLMLAFWGISFLVCMLIYGLGHIIALLTSIDGKMKKK